MKKNLFVVTALLASGITFAQEKKAPPPPPPAPPAIEAKEVPPPPPPPPAPELLMTKEYAAFLKRNKEVKQVEWTDERKVTIHLKSGKSEAYDLDQKEDAKKLKDKYGELPDASVMLPPPPLPPTPPAPPTPPKKTKQQ